MSLTATFLIYATLYRLAIVAAGALVVILGYRLFVRGVVKDGGSGTDASAEAGGFKFSLKGAAPGTCFAVFGAALIVTMVVQGNPELALREAGDAPSGVIQTAATRTVSLKGRDGAPPAFTNAMREAEALVVRRELATAIATYGQALSVPDISGAEIAAVSGRIAEIYLEQGRTREALALARLAVQIDADDADRLEVLANAATSVGERAEAAAALRRATAVRSAEK